MSGRNFAMQINFVRQSWQGLLRSTPLWAAGCAIGGVALVIYACLESNRIAERQQDLQTAMTRASSKSHQVEPTAPPVPEARALAVNNAIAQLNLPWSDLFDAIEQATPANIALVALEPDAKRQLLKGEAEALNSDDMIAYIERLKKTPQFVSVVLTKHAVDEQDPFKPYRFSFEAQWRERVL